MLHIDFETRSEVELKTAGLHVYAAHPSTRVLCMAYAFDDGPVLLWKPGEPFPGDVVDYVFAGKMVAAHNAPFEIEHWNGHLVAQVTNGNTGNHCGCDAFGGSVNGARRNRVYCARCFPRLKPAQCDCTMARAYALSLPGGLDELGLALRLPVQKDKRGRYLIQRLCKPQKARDGTLSWNNDPGLMQELYAYCIRDVEVERAASKLLMPLSASERDTWRLDQQINARGIRVDTAGAQRALALADDEGARAAWEVADITSGVVLSATQVKGLQAWLDAKGVKTKSLTKTTVAALLRDNPDAAPEVRRILELRQESSKASVAKLRAMLRSVSVDGRARGLFQYHGAGTGRWAGRRIQLQNMPRCPDEFTPDTAIDVLEWLQHPRAFKTLRAIYNLAPMELLSWSLRALLVAAHGCYFLAADYSNIEGRVLVWLAGEAWKLQAFRDFDAGTGHDLYNIAYSKSFGIPPDAVTKAQRQLGKVQELALGFGGGKGAFASMAANYGIWVGNEISDAPPDAAQALTYEQADELKVAWRDAHPAVVALWRELDAAARQAIKRPGVAFPAAGGKIVYKMHGIFLLCRLPSGRVIAYPYARLELDYDFDTRRELQTVRARIKELAREGRGAGDAIADKWIAREALLAARPKTDWLICYEGLDSKTHKWGKQNAYGGFLAENVTQAVARDILTEAMHRLDAAGYTIVLHVHDEIVCEVPEGSKQNLEEMESIMRVLPAWAAGLPVATSGWQGMRYRK